MGSTVIPEVDMLTVSKNSRVQRRAILGFAPNIGLSCVDYGELDRIDTFYLNCQNYRDYYRDPYNKMPKPEFFRLHQGKCGIKLDRNIDMLMQPITWRIERQPVIYPIQYGHEMNLDTGFSYGGKYDCGSDIRFKR